MQSKPNLFIVGAPKAGTTFLFKKLQDHPDLFFPKIKELNYFSHQELFKYNSYYKDFKIKDARQYLKFYKNSQSRKYRLDCSTSYFSFSEVPEKIKNFNPESKIIFILRNPIKRAFSHYLMDVRMGYSDLPFEEYLQNKKKHPAHYRQYVENSLYHKQVKKYEDVFGKENLCILFLENIEKDIIKLFEFLNIPKIQINTGERVNQNKKPKNYISQMLQKNRDLTSKLKMIVSPTIANKFKGMLYEKANEEKILEEDFYRLRNILDNDITKLDSLTNLDLKNLWNLTQ